MQFPRLLRILCLTYCLTQQTIYTCDLLSFNANTTLSKILEAIALDCKLNIIYTQDLAHKILDSKVISLHFDNASLQDILQTLLTQNDIGFTLENNLLSIWALQTKTFSINYISTARVGSSNTDVFFSQDSQNTLNTYQNPYTMQNFSTFESTQQAHKMALNKAAGHTLGTGKSGTKIYSIDEMDFWGELENEIYNIAYRPGDWYTPDSGIDTPQDTKDSKYAHKDIIINKGAGLLTITGSQKQIDRVEQYLASLAQKIHAQVLIDVNIFNVEHNDSATYGIDWEQFFNLTNLATAPMGSDNSSALILDNSGTSYGINIFSQGVSIERIVEFLQTYGKVESISNPKVLTLNNQPAIISVGSVLRYQQNTTYQTTTQGTSVQNASEIFPSVFAGILLDVTPSIEGKKIILKINPSITKTKDVSIENQTTALSSPPNLATKHLSSLVAIEDGQRIVLGGLIDKTETKIRKQIPVLGSIPLLKYLFSYTKNTQLTKEMVIILSPKIMNPQAIEQLQDEIPQIPAYEDSSLPLSNMQPAPNIRDLTLSYITDSHTLNVSL
ncbi:pilus (MSHA type) biogenesis protein MshL [Helicobacter equorum]|uniref:Pilus (MSHA type) biogenesis protein MshL n=1 Tax=Helicobacter equorum TaxID=361872 RepID=A0A3D8ISR4_9HELI|nr:pilus (MSHA type) biogenesis protein MshL [Helicobacter equorum]RDU68242.1 pilus (MSHA type) biogenesis protein MshL [Helicobacter equorum]